MKMASTQLVLCLLFLAAFHAVSQPAGAVASGTSASSKTHVNFVVVGATGSLAQKYLWQGMYDLKAELIAGRKARGRDSNHDLILYGGARAEPLKGTKAMDDILNTKVSYADEKAKEDFRASVQFVQLKTCDHYEALCTHVLNNVHYTSSRTLAGGHCHADNGRCDDESSNGNDDDDTPRILANHDEVATEAGRIFYLAVPPYSYAEVAKCIHRVCRPSNKQAFLRLVLEKPFGTNVDTVNSLVKSLKEDFQEEEIYLVDHYLGKPAVQQILEFRNLNRVWLEPLLNSHRVEKVEIAIKEKEDVEGRLNYFDTYGVFLDVLQNHAVEMLCLVAMNLPSGGGRGDGSSVADSEAIRREKLRFLNAVLPIHRDHVVAAQYSDYVAHGKLEFGNENFDSNTPTFGAVVLQVPNSRWRGVPFFLVSGKALDAKMSFVKITFKNTTFSIVEGQSDQFRRPQFSSASSTKGEIAIYASSPSNSKPWMSISKTISSGHPVVTSWREITSSESDHHVFQFEGRDRAYSTVVADVFFGHRENFVSMKQLTASWAIWDHVLQSFTKDRRPKLYGKNAPQDLEVTWSASGLHFVTSGQPRDEETAASLDKEVITPKQLHFCNNDDDDAKATSVVVKPTWQLVQDIVRDLTEIAESGGSDDQFHLAIPGGNTPSPIFHELLASELGHRFPWHKTHVWFTDERCVPLSHHQSNFFNAQESLLKHLQLSHLNVHPMPVDLRSEMCSSDDHDGTTLYDDQLRRHLGENRSLDVVLLGVGADGHVASIFPSNEDQGVDHQSENVCNGDGNDDDDDGQWVKLTRAGRAHAVEQRMSLTLKTISRAKTVFLVITGKGKHGVVEQLTNDADDGSVARLPSSRFPVRNIAAANSLRVYIDNDAYFG